VSALFPASRQADDRPRSWAKKKSKDLLAETSALELGTGTGALRLRIGLGSDSVERPTYGVWS
jgi:hypothetical protein